MDNFEALIKDYIDDDIDHIINVLPLARKTETYRVEYVNGADRYVEVDIQLSELLAFVWAKMRTVQMDKENKCNG